MRRYFFDTEFTESAGGVTLISIGVVADDGSEYYAESDNFYPTLCTNGWIKGNVVPHLTGPRKSEAQIANELRKFVQTGESWRDTEFWAYYGAYDWYLLCRLFSGMLYLPAKWPWLFHDLRLWLDERGFPEFKQPDNAPHHALADARWNREAFLMHNAKNP
jgi:3'-5' exoribonuclease-like protein